MKLAASSAVNVSTEQNQQNLVRLCSIAYHLPLYDASVIPVIRSQHPGWYLEGFRAPPGLELERYLLERGWCCLRPSMGDC